MDQTGVMELIEELQILLEDAKPAFGRSNLCQVDKDSALDILDDIKDAVGPQLAQSRQIVRERQSLLDDAEAEADQIIKDAQDQAETIASKQEIVRIAKQQAEQISADARDMERQTRAGAEDYADEVLGHVEQSLGSLIDNVRRNRERVNSGALGSSSSSATPASGTSVSSRS